VFGLGGAELLTLRLAGSFLAGLKAGIENKPSYRSARRCATQNQQAATADACGTLARHARH
jgi:hypothetical protein